MGRSPKFFKTTSKSSFYHSKAHFRFLEAAFYCFEAVKRECDDNKRLSDAIFHQSEAIERAHRSNFRQSEAVKPLSEALDHFVQSLRRSD